MISLPTVVRETPRDLREVDTGLPTWAATPRQGFPLKAYPFRPWLSGGSVTIDAASRQVYAVDPDAGTLAVVDTTRNAVTRTVPACARPEQVVVSGAGRAYVSCRGAGAVVALDPAGAGPAVRADVGAEPFGLALSPDGGVVYVTTALVPRLQALDARTLAPLWQVELPEHPRGVAVSPDGRQAIVAHLSGDSISVVDLREHRRVGAELPRHRDGWPLELLEGAQLEGLPTRVAGGAFAAIVSPGGTRAFVPYVLKNDGSQSEVTFVAGCYANGASFPVAASIAAVDLQRRQVQRPTPTPLPPDRQVESSADIGTISSLGVVRAAFHDPLSSRVFVVGDGSGILAAFDTSRADPTAAPLGAWMLGAPARGVALDRQGRRAYVHLALDHQVAVVDLSPDRGAEPIVARISVGSDDLPEAVARGRKLFHTANDPRMVGITGVACTSCHYEGREDGVTWRLDGRPVQTPMLAGRVAHDGRLRWGGEAANLREAVAEAVTRLQGTGLLEDDIGALLAYMQSDAMLPPASPHGVDAVARRGEELFEESGCTSCHAPDADFTDRQVHRVRGGQFRTPSLRGLFLTAPYYHDGSARSLADLLAAHDRGNPMAVGARLSQNDLSALERYLRSL